MNDVRCRDCANLVVVSSIGGPSYKCKVPGEKRFDPIEGWVQDVHEPNSRNLCGDCNAFRQKTEKPKSNFLKRLFGKV